MDTGTIPLRRVEGFDDVRVLSPGIGWYAERIAAGRPFAYLKRTHGFWDRLVELADEQPAFRALVAESLRRDDDAFPSADDVARACDIDDAVRARLVAIRPKYKGFFEDGYAADLVRDLRAPHPGDAWVEAIAFRGYTRGGEKPSHHPAARLRETFLALRSRRMRYHDALAFKDAVVDGGFLRVVEALRTLPVVLVGPPHLAAFGERAGIPRFRHVPIHPFEAIREREQTLAACRREAARAGGAPAAFVFQAGSVAWWLMHRLRPHAPDALLVDGGRALDVWFPDVVERQPWFRADRDAIVRNMRLGALYAE